MVKDVGKKFWFTFWVLIVLWVMLGFALPKNDVPVNDLFDFASLAAFFAAAAFVVIYTIAGFIGHEPRPRWWKNEVGTYLVLAFVSIMFVVGPAAFAVLFNDGQINTWWWAWAWIGGHLMAAFTIASLAFLWLRKVWAQAT